MTARLRILTWNIWMMPWFTFQSPGNRRRAAAIAEELLKLDADILCLEKVFDRGARDVLVKTLGSRYPHRYGPANSGFNLKVNSGVWVLSKFPLPRRREIQFRDSTGIESASRKGAMLLAGNFHGHPFQIVATHLQGESGSSYTEAHQRIRDRQFLQIRDELLTPYSDPSAPLFLCGDLDTPRHSEGYRFLMDTFGNPGNGSEYRITLDDNRSRNDLAMDNKGRTDELDYILVRPGSANLSTEWSLRIILRPGWDGKTTRQNLSYRHAVEAAIDFL